MADGAPTTTADKPGLAAKLPMILNLLFVVINIGVMGGGVYFIYNLKFNTHRPVITDGTEMIIHSKERELRQEKPVTYSFDKFTINLDGKPRKILQTDIMVELLDEEGYEEVVTKNSIMRDQILRILNSKKLNDIETIQGKLFLKEQIATSMNKIFSAGTVKEIYFTSFLIQ